LSVRLSRTDELLTRKRKRKGAEKPQLVCTFTIAGVISGPIFISNFQMPRGPGAPETTKSKGAASYLRAISGVVAGATPPPKFWAVRKSSSCQIFFRRKMQTLKLKNSYFGKFRVKIKILSTHGLLCRTFAAVCRNSVEQFSVSVGKLQ